MPAVHIPRASLETLLRARRLDGTLTTSLAPLSPPGAVDPQAVGATGLTALDAMLGGGFPRGQLSEIAGARSTGRASLALGLLAAATARGELTALVDALDMLDVESASAAGVDLDRLLWIRGHVAVHPGLCHDTNQRAMEQAIRALSLVLSAGQFGLVVFDAGEAPPQALKRLPFTTWLRLQRLIEGRQTVCVLVGSEPVARSAAGLTVRLGSACGRAGAPSAAAALGCRVGPRRQWENVGQVGSARFSGRLFDGLDIEARVIRAHTRAHGEAGVVLSALAGGRD